MVGSTISHYTILEKLGEGGMGVVYKAQDLKLDRTVALKFLPSHFASPQEIARFQQEAKAISALNHPSIATIYDIDQADDQQFLVLEFLSGGTLKSRIRELTSTGRQLSLPEIVDYGIQIAEGLAHAHLNGIVHRDIKSENMMLTADGKIKITDFGLAKLRGGAQLTKTGTTVGTASYMSPEQIHGEVVDSRSDLFSFGIVLYELATGSFPFRGEHEAAVSYAITNEDPVPLRTLRPSLSVPFEHIIRRCLEKDRSKRYQTADEIVRDLRSFQSGVASAAGATRKSVLPWFVAAGLVAAMIAGLFVFRPNSDVPIRGKSIAVLPFKNLSNDPENEYFSDGVTEEIIAQLSNISDLEVISPTTVMQYKNSPKPVKDIARELGVATVLEGSVQKADNEVRIVAQLIDAGTDENIWAETYDRELKQIFAIQSDVADRIAVALNTKLSSSEKERLGARGTNNIVAYNAFLKAEYHWNKITTDDMKLAISFYKDAIADDPLYARAYAGLSNAYSLTAYFRFDFISPGDAVKKAREAARKALELDPNLAEAHTALGYIFRTFDWDFPQAEQEFKRSIELDPNNSVTRHFYGLLLAALSRFSEATVQMNRAVELDRLSTEILTSRARVYYYSQRYDEAITCSKDELEIDQDSRLAHGLLGCIYELKHMRREALAEFKSSKTISGTDFEGASAIYQPPMTNDWDTYWKQNEKVAENLCKQNRFPYIAYAVVALRAGMRERAIRALQESYRRHEGSLVYLNVDPEFSPIRSDPRIQEILREINPQ
ncbi:MAG TPA: protein kinase [Bacteroidota bacterium]|nr:protein kinase [Bacteroidota bacterium]